MAAVRTTILFVRHGESDWNAERRIQGHTDRPLSGRGRAQARALAAELSDEPLDAVYTSDLTRARETAEAIAEQRRLAVAVDPRLRERNFGSWEGLTDDEALARFPEAAEEPWGDGETVEAMTDRVLEALQAIAARHPGGRALVVSHGGPLRAVLRRCGAPRVDQILNCHVARIAVEDGDVRSVD